MRRLVLKRRNNCSVAALGSFFSDEFPMWSSSIVFRVSVIIGPIVLLANPTRCYESCWARRRLATANFSSIFFWGKQPRRGLHAFWQMTQCWHWFIYLLLNVLRKNRNLSCILVHWLLLRETFVWNILHSTRLRYHINNACLKTTKTYIPWTPHNPENRIFPRSFLSSMPQTKISITFRLKETNCKSNY